MGKKHLQVIVILLSFLLASSSLFAQGLNIEGDTIRVSKKAFGRLKFQYEPEHEKLCDGYNISSEGQILTIRPQSDAPNGCRLIVREGSKSNRREHLFILMNDKTVDADDQDYDFSTKDRILTRIKYLKAAKERAAQGGEEATEEKEEEVPKKRGGKNADKLAKEAEKAPKFKTPEKPEKIKGADKIAKTAVKEEDVPESTEKVVAKAGKTGGKGVQKVVKSEDEEVPPPATEESTVAVKQSSTSKEEELLLSIPEEKIKERVEKKIKDFYRVCVALTDGDDAEREISIGMKELFNNDETKRVGTTNKKGVKGSTPIREYFGHLVDLGKRYGEVKMTASDITFVSDFKYKDGLWYGTAVVVQDFTAYKDYNIVAYKDRTTKAIQVIMRVFEEVKNGKATKRFEIYLGNISVTNTGD